MTRRIDRPATPRQLEVMRILRRHEQETGEGIRLCELAKLTGKGAHQMLRTLEAKDWAENEDARWYLTDDGVDLVDSLPVPTEPVKTLPPEEPKPKPPKKAASKPKTLRKPLILSLADNLPPNHWTVVAAETVDAVATEYGVTREEIVGRSRMNRVVAARRIAMIRLRKLDLSLAEIGALLGRDHTSIATVIRRMREAAE